MAHRTHGEALIGARAQGKALIGSRTHGKALIGLRTHVEALIGSKTDHVLAMCKGEVPEQCRPVGDYGYEWGCVLVIMVTRCMLVIVVMSGGACW